MTDTEWEDFIHSERAEGSKVMIVVPKEERGRWPLGGRIVQSLQEIEPGSSVVQFDSSIPDGTIAVVKEMSFCGWLKVILAGGRETMVPGWYLQPLPGTANKVPIEVEVHSGGQ